MLGFPQSVSVPCHRKNGSELTHQCLEVPAVPLVVGSRWMHHRVLSVETAGDQHGSHPPGTWQTQD